MSLESEFEQSMLEGYRRAGDEAGYWGTRYLQSIRRNGGLATAKRMLQPRNAGQRSGLDALLAAGKPELTLEAIVLEPRFQSLFTHEELAEAERRLEGFKKASKKHREGRERLYPDELELGQKYVEGAKKQIRVNAYERDPRARKACLKHHGYRCVACGFLFSDRYGSIGEGFIHVHHLRPLAALGAGYKIDPVKDLVPVCPNCHAMLHRKEPAITVEELRATLLANARGS